MWSCQSPETLHFVNSTILTTTMLRDYQQIWSDSGLAGADSRDFMAITPDSLLLVLHKASSPIWLATTLHQESHQPVMIVTGTFGLRPAEDDAAIGTVERVIRESVCLCAATAQFVEFELWSCSPRAEWLVALAWMFGSGCSICPHAYRLCWRRRYDKIRIAVPMMRKISVDGRILRCASTKDTPAHSRSTVQTSSESSQHITMRTMVICR